MVEEIEVAVNGKDPIPIDLMRAYQDQLREKAADAPVTDSASSAGATATKAQAKKGDTSKKQPPAKKKGNAAAAKKKAPTKDAGAVKKKASANKGDKAAAGNYAAGDHKEFDISPANQVLPGAVSFFDHTKNKINDSLNNYLPRGHMGKKFFPRRDAPNYTYPYSSRAHSVVTFGRFGLTLRILPCSLLTIQRVCSPILHRHVASQRETDLRIHQ